MSMTINNSFGRGLRLQRLYHNSERLLVVPLDHSVSDGPVLPDGRLDHLLGQLADNGADAVVLHKESLRLISPRWFRSLSLIVHLSAGTRHAPDPHARCLVSTVDEVLRLGADAVSIHVNMGSQTEPRQLADFGRVAEACDRWNVPLLAMVYARGRHIKDQSAPALVAHTAAIAAELGADLVKTAYPGSAAAMREVTAACPIPVLVAGGEITGDGSDIFTRVDGALAGGASGVAVGRHVFTAADPGSVTRKLSDLVHGHFEPA
jgi:2-amino-4,5-dihydroxy-6-oxo-7-(phosphooxy)heptanoate synthase